MMTDEDRIVLSPAARSALSDYGTIVSTWEITEQVIREGMEGDLVECGVYCGAQVAAMAMACNKLGVQRRVHLFDSFKGRPQAGPNDEAMRQGDIGRGHNAGDGTGDLVPVWDSPFTVAHVRNALVAWGVPSGFVADVCVFHEGWFQETMPADAAGIDKIAILRLDADLYESTRVCLEHLFPKVVERGFVIIDDYALFGCKKAFHEYVDMIGYAVPEFSYADGSRVPFFRK